MGNEIERFEPGKLYRDVGGVLLNYREVKVMRGIKANTRVFENGVIESDIVTAVDGLRDSVVRDVLDTRDDHVKQALEKLGWISPEEARDLRAEVESLKAENAQEKTTIVNVPDVGSRWRRNGSTFGYTVRAVANIGNISSKYPATVVYQGANGLWWSKILEQWPGSLVPCGDDAKGDDDE